MIRDCVVRSELKGVHGVPCGIEIEVQQDRREGMRGETTNKNKQVILTLPLQDAMKLAAEIMNKCRKKVDAKVLIDALLKADAPE